MNGGWRKWVLGGTVVLLGGSLAMARPLYSPLRSPLPLSRPLALDQKAQAAGSSAPEVDANIGAIPAGTATSDGSEIRLSVPETQGKMARAPYLAPVRVNRADDPPYTDPFRGRGLSLADWHPTVEALREKIILASDDGSRTEAWLDYAQLLMSKGLLGEADAVMVQAQRLAEGDVLYKTQKRTEVYSLILALLQKAPTVPYPLDSHWGDAGFWSSRAAIIIGRQPTQTEIEATLAGLDAQGGAISAILLPDLLDAAIRGGFFQTAENVYRAGARIPDIAGTPLYLFMQANLAAAEGKNDLAVSSYAKVAAGEGELAAKARLALASMAVDKNDPRLLPSAQDMLVEGLGRWNEGATGRQLLSLIAQISEDRHDTRTSLAAMAELQRRYDGTDAADLAHIRAAVILHDLVQRAEAGEVTLSDMIAAIRELPTSFDTQPGWFEARMKLANMLAQRGLNGAARAEYADIHAHFVSQPKIDMATLDRVAVNEMEAAVAVGDPELVAQAKARRSMPEDPVLRHRYLMAALQGAQLYQQGHPNEDIPPVLEAVSLIDAQSASEDLLRLAGKVSIRAGKTDDAERFFAALQMQGRHGATDGAIMEQLSAAPANADVSVDRVVAGMDMRFAPAVKTLAEGKNAPLPALEPLSSATVEGMLAQADNVVAAVSALDHAVIDVSASAAGGTVIPNSTDPTGP